MSKLTPSLMAVVMAAGAVFTPLVLADANRTERITLKFVAAGEIERVLLGDAAPLTNGVGGGLGPGAKTGALPSGIVAFTADPETASITATGTPAGLDELKNILRLLDVPKRRIRWTIHALEPDENLRAAAVAAPELDRAQAEKLARDAEKVGALQFRSELIGANQLPVFLFPKSSGTEGKLFLQARVNGDETVTLILHGNDRRLMQTRRVPPGKAALFLPDGSTALLIQAELLPDAKLN
jgi:hypothetical protein